MGHRHCATLLLVTLLNCALSENSPNIKDFKDAAGIITAKLYKSFRSKNADNMLFSPISIAAALSMLAEGASGKTKAALESAAGLKEESREQFGFVMNTLQNNAGKQPGVEELRMVNSIWIPISEKMPSGFHSVLKRRYSADTRAADFSQGEKVAEVVNSRIEKLTRGVIKNLLSKDSVTSDVKLLLMNALYFNGKWLYRFSKEDTREADFLNAKGEKVKVNMMNSNVTIRAGHACCNVKATIAVLPYSPEERFSLVVIVPDEPMGYRDVEEELFSEPALLPKVVRRLSVRDIELSLPRFEIETTAGLKEALEDMGLGMLFTPEADLPNIIHQQRAVLSSALHKAKITVNEEGTEAAGASVFQITPLMADFDQTHEVRANRTFIYTIWDNDNEVPLFVGRVGSPSPAERPQRSGNKSKRQISFRQAKRYFRKAEEQVEQTTPDEVEEKGVTGAANWWKPTPPSSVLVSLQKRPNPAPAESLLEAPAKRPSGFEMEAIPVVLSNPPVLVGLTNFINKPPPNPPLFTTDRLVPRPPIGPSDIVGFPGLAVREPLKKQQGDKDSLVFPNQAV